MKREPQPTLKENYVYKVHFDSLTYHTDDSDDPYDAVVYQDGGTIEDTIEVIYDGGGIE